MISVNFSLGEEHDEDTIKVARGDLVAVGPLESIATTQDMKNSVEKFVMMQDRESNKGTISSRYMKDSIKLSKRDKKVKTR